MQAIYIPLWANIDTGSFEALVNVYAFLTPHLESLVEIFEWDPRLHIAESPHAHVDSSESLSAALRQTLCQVAL